MGMLVVYCLKNVSFGAIQGFLPSMISVAAVVLLHIWKRNTLLSILGGTALYMVLIRLLGSI
jgi:branched-subunit amino acid transport protein AzlD